MHSKPVRCQSSQTHAQKTQSSKFFSTRRSGGALDAVHFSSSNLGFRRGGRVAIYGQPCGLLFVASFPAVVLLRGASVRVLTWQSGGNPRLSLVASCASRRFLLVRSSA